MSETPLARLVLKILFLQSAFFIGFIHALQNAVIYDHTDSIVGRLSGTQGKVGQGPPEASSSEPTSRPKSVTFSSPLLDYGYPPTVTEYQDGSLRKKPLLLYLPGFDGTYLSPFLQFPELGDVFDVRCMTVDMEDRSTFQELRQGVLDFLCNELSANSTLDEPLAKNVNTTSSEGELGKEGISFFSNMLGMLSKASDTKDTSTRPVYLAGESFGGILACEIALSILGDPSLEINLQGQLLINPATCFDRSQLAALGPQVYSLSRWAYPLGLTKLLPLFADDYSLEQLLLILSAKALPSVIDNPVREAYMGRVAFSLPSRLKYMPQETLKWRLEQWLAMGCQIVDDQRLSEFSKRHSQFRTLLVAGEHDKTLPSIAEAERLSNLLPNVQVFVVEGAGHASTCGSRVDLAAHMRKRFRELRTESSKGISWGQKNSSTPSRIAMKDSAAKGTGAWLGMEPRYDGADIGLSPLEYWSSRYYRPIQVPKRQRQYSTS